MMAYYRCEVVFKGRAVDVNEDLVESDVAGKTHHVFYHNDDKKISEVRTLLGAGFEMKPVSGDVVVFLTQAEAGKLISEKLACAEK
jgi:hypothetical protein